MSTNADKCLLIFEILCHIKKGEPLQKGVYFLSNFLNIFALLFYSQKKEEEKLSLKKCVRGPYKKLWHTDRQKQN